MFTITIGKLSLDVSDQQHKELLVASQLATLNDQPVPSAEEHIMAAVQATIDTATSSVKVTNDINRAEKIKALAENDVAAVDAAIGYEPLEKGVVVK